MSAPIYTELQRIRMACGFKPDDTASLPDEQIQDALDRAGERTSDPTVQRIAATVLVLEQLYAEAVTATDYTQNNTQEKASQRFDHYGKLLDKWNKALAQAEEEAAVAAAGGTVRSGRQVRKPARLKEFPGGPWSWDISRP
jgi:hypothetical protein